MTGAERILRDLRVVADQLGTDRLTVRLYNEHRSTDMLPSSTIRDRMGGWARACTEAGLVAAGQGPAKVPDEVVIGWMRDVAAQLETTTLSMSDYDKYAPAGAITSMAIHFRFGSWAAACDLAGLAAARRTGVRRGVAREERVAQVRQTAERIGVVELSRSDYDRLRDKSQTTDSVNLSRLFGSWTEVCRLAGLSTGPNRRA